LGRFEEAVDAAAVAMTVHSSSEELLAKAHRRKYLSYMELGDLSGVVTEATTVIELEPNDIEMFAEAYVYRALAHGFAGEVVESEADLREVLVLLPEDHRWAQNASALLAES
jgi:tetratricopeptide (TPR) repeat protein